MLSNLDLKTRTLLSRAILQRDLEVAKYLLEQCDANVESRDEHGRTPLMLACQLGYFQMVQYLLRTRPHLQINAVDNSGLTAFSIACAGWSAEPHPKHTASWTTALKPVSAEGKTAGTRHDGSSPADRTDEHHHAKAHAAASANNSVFDWNLVRFLVTVGRADVNLADKAGRTVLIRVADHKTHSGVKATAKAELAQPGPSTPPVASRADSKGKDSTESAGASQSGELELARWLIKDCNVDVHARDAKGCTGRNLIQ